MSYGNLACKHAFRFGAYTVSTSETDAKVKAGFARAASLSDKRRREIAREAAVARWSADIPWATHDGPLHIGNREIFAAVLPNGSGSSHKARFFELLAARVRRRRVREG